MKDKYSAVFWMFALLGLSCVVVTMDRRVFWVLASSIRHDLGFTQQQVQMAEEAMQFGWGMTSLGVGYLIRVANLKGLAIAGLMIVSLATLAATYALNFPSMFFTGLVLGAGVALNIQAILMIGINHFPRQRSNVASAAFFFMGAGALIAVNLGSIINEASDWRATLITFGLVGLPMAIMMFIFAKSRFTEATGSQKLDSYQFQQSLARSIWSRRVLLLGTMTVLLSLCLCSFRYNYLKHIREAGGFTWQFGEVAVSAYAFGNLFAFYGASVFRRYGARRVIRASFALTGILSLCAVAISMEYVFAQVVLYMLLGICTGGITVVALLSAMIDSVVAAQRAPVVGLFFCCLLTPIVLFNKVCQLAESVIGYGATGALLMSVSAFIATVLATQLPTHRQYR